jgi:hypothetical protein
VNGLAMALDGNAGEVRQAIEIGGEMIVRAL